MTIVKKESPIGSLGLAPGVHWLKVVVAGDTVAYELMSQTPHTSPSQRKGTGFVRKWSGTARKDDDSDNEWLSHINAKHLR